MTVTFLTDTNSFLARASRVKVPRRNLRAISKRQTIHRGRFSITAIPRGRGEDRNGIRSEYRYGLNRPAIIPQFPLRNLRLSQMRPALSRFSREHASERTRVRVSRGNFEIVPQTSPPISGRVQCVPGCFGLSRRPSYQHLPPCNPARWSAAGRYNREGTDRRTDGLRQSSRRQHCDVYDSRTAATRMYVA